MVLWIGVTVHRLARRLYSMMRGHPTERGKSNSSEPSKTD